MPPPVCPPIAADMIAEVGEFSDVEVVRENPTQEDRFIDRNIRDEVHKFAVISENKVRAGESHKQFEDYWKALKETILISRLRDYSFRRMEESQSRRSSFRSFHSHLEN
jgi:hypothetical protein